MAFDASTYREGVPYLPPKRKHASLPGWVWGLFGIGCAAAAGTVAYVVYNGIEAAQEHQASANIMRELMRSAQCPPTPVPRHGNPLCD